MTLKFRCCIIFLFVVSSLRSQETEIDSLRKVLASEKNDTTYLLLLEKFANIFSEINPDSAYYYADQAAQLAKRLRIPVEEVVALDEMGYAQLNMGNYPRSLQYLLAAIAIAENPEIEKNVLSAKFPVTDDYTDRTKSNEEQRKVKLCRTLQYIAILYGNSGNYDKALYYYRRTIPIAEEVKNDRVLSITYTTMGRTFLSMGETDSALKSLHNALRYANHASYFRYLGSIFLNTGRAHLAMGRADTAKIYFRESLKESEKNKYFRGVVASSLMLASMNKKNEGEDSALFYIKHGLDVTRKLNAPDLYLRCYTALADYYQKNGNSDSTVKYQALIIKTNETLFNSKQAQQFQNIDFDARQQQVAVEAAKKDFRNQLQKYLMLGGLAIILPVAFFLWRSNRNRQKLNIVLKKQNTEIENAMANLRSTQSQLIQAEKMASLGELTQGIAHEIQNPLNFVNNFSEVNKDLLIEMKDELQKGHLDEVNAIADDIIINEEKISQHGKRAGSIVKGMLQHSRSSTGEKEPTDLNSLADEYMRLAYHASLSVRQTIKGNNISLSTTDTGSNIVMKTDFDSRVGKINIIPQDIGKVLFNLFNNAFYSVAEKRKSNPGYNPEVSVKTLRKSDSVEITVTDNGTGIPEKITDKIFQPFFTTKPTGQGTGLGLSLSYDIVKVHGGEITVNNKPGEGADFIVSLPIV